MYMYVCVHAHMDVYVCVGLLYIINFLPDISNYVFSICIRVSMYMCKYVCIKDTFMAL